MTITVAEIAVADAPEAWARAGFAVDSDDVCRVGGVDIRLARQRPRHRHRRVVVAWPAATARPTTSTASRQRGPARSRRCRPCTRTASPTSTTSCCSRPTWAERSRALAAIGVEPRRERDAQLGGRPIRQIFVRFADVIIEVVGSPDDRGRGPSTLWGITYEVADIDATAAYFGDRTAPVKDAVQPGRRITTLRHHELGMSVRSAMISAPILGT